MLNFEIETEKSWAGSFVRSLSSQLRRLIDKRALELEVSLPGHFLSFCKSLPPTPRTHEPCEYHVARPSIFVVQASTGQLRLNNAHVQAMPQG